MNQDKRESEDYWLGVRDALRMIDSFVKWSKRNPHRAKNIEQFISDGLIAAAKRCKSCLSKELGITFLDDDEEQELEVEGTTESDEVSLDFDESFEESQPEFEESPLRDAMGYGSSETSDEMSEELASTTEVAFDDEGQESEDDTDSFGVTIEKLGTPTDTTISEVEIKSNPRDFASDFDVAEPEPLIISEQDEVEDTVDAVDEDIDEIKSPDDPEAMESDYDSEPTEEVDSPPAPPSESSFTWRDYEESFETSDSESSIRDSPSETSEFTEKKWTPYDEPVADELDDTEMDDESDEEGEIPPSPPAPESDESEEERRRRARRLFFGT